MANNIHNTHQAVIIRQCRQILRHAFIPVGDAERELRDGIVVHEYEGAILVVTGGSIHQLHLVGEVLRLTDTCVVHQSLEVRHLGES